MLVVDKSEVRVGMPTPPYNPLWHIRLTGSL